jgi:alpha-tubulin suppressor-like RCC1 family protein
MVSMGTDNGCAIKAADNSLWCWGNNGSGQVGQGYVSAIIDTPTQVMAGTQFQAVSNGEIHNCAITTTGALYCWGYNNNGECGTTATSNYEATPKRVQSPDTFIAVSAGGTHTCAIRTGGNLFCWGENYSGQIGNGTQTSPVLIPYNHGGNFTAVAAGGSHSCGITGGILRCWGYDYYGTLGVAPPVSPYVYPSEQTVPGSGWTQVSAGGSHTCGLKGTALSCFGADTAGQLGNNTSNSNANATPYAIPTLQFKAIEVGGDTTCALTTADTLMCWGANGGGGVGIGTAGLPVLVPTSLGPTTWLSFSHGGGTGCGVKTDGSLACWGSNFWGEFGDDSIQFLTPQPFN